MRQKNKALAIVAALGLSAAASSYGCEKGLLSDRKEKMWISSPLTIEDVESGNFEDLRVSKGRPDESTWSQIKNEIASGAELYTFAFYTDPNSGDFWGYDGFILVRDDCVTHEFVSNYVN